MAVFCDMCGTQFGFFASKKKLKVDEVTKTVCKKCFKENQENRKSNLEALMPEENKKKKTIKKKGTKVAQLTTSWDKTKFPLLVVDAFPFGIEGLKLFEESLEGGRETRLIKAVCKDMILYGPTEKGLKEGHELMTDSMKKWKTDEEKAKAILHIGTFTAYIMKDPVSALYTLLPANLIKVDTELRIEILKMQLTAMALADDIVDMTGLICQKISELTDDKELKSKALFTKANIYIEYLDEVEKGLKEHDKLLKSQIRKNL
jgi:hypothetical protein